MKIVASIRQAIGSLALPFMVSAAFLFIYMPILVLIVFSFNEVAFPYRWSGFTLKWYYQLFASPEIWPVVKNSLIVASSATILSLVMGIFMIFYSAQSKLRSWYPIFYANVVFPEVVVSVGLLSFFVLFSVPFSLLTLIAGHTVLGLGFVVPILSTRFAELDKSIIEASLDLGATINQTFYRVIIPMMMPAIIAAGLLVFVISFDDFLIAFFCAGSSSQTLPLYIFSMIRSGISPTINALSVILILLSSLFVLIFCSLKSKIRIF